IRGGAQSRIKSTRSEEGQMQSTNGGAVVIEASMAGLLTARVLADRFDQVTVIDRDDLPPGPDSRKGVPQGRHAHGLLASGELVFRDLFPGLMEDLVTAGAERVSVRQARWWQYGGYRVACPAPEGTFLSRPFLEAGVRQRVLSRPNVKRLAVAFPIEGDRWIVTLAGFHGDNAPADDAGYLAFAESLPTDDVAGIIREEEPASPIVTHRLPSNQWRHFEKVKAHPGHFLAMGDAICSFNPIYGQGMSSAALQAAALGACLDRYGPASDGLSRRFYRDTTKIIANAWGISAGGDFSYPQTTGP